MVREVADAMVELLAGGERGALATVIRAAGSTPQQAGARLLLFPDGRTVGTVGGGAIEKDVIDALAQCIADGKSQVLVRDLARDLGMCCGGRMEVFVEPVQGTQRLFVFGAGHVAKPTAAMARSLGFDVTVVDDRDELNTEERFPGCRRVLAEPAESLAELGLTERDWILVVTHDHRLDEEALDACARAPHRYIGVIGSRRKIVRILQRIEQRRGLPPLDRVYAPVGLDIGAVSPEEIAVSICAELVALRHNHAAPHMRAIDRLLDAASLAKEET
jgi:xanthine dehydrogenase accessory factor